MDSILLTRLQNWYLTNCNGDWEHTYGISIDTLDNPGWSIKIDLTDTCLEELKYDKQIDNGLFDWLIIKVIDKVFQASGDASKLTTILMTFLDDIVTNHTDPNFQYEVFVQLIGGPVKVWRPVKAKMISEDTLQIIEIPELVYRDLRTTSLDDLTFSQKEIFNYESNISIGDTVKVELIETFNGITLAARQ